MSYILEALKKSDQKRKQGNIPDLQTVHMSLPVDVQQSRWPYIVIVILLMGLVFLLGWMRPWQSVENTDAAQSKIQTEPQLTIASSVQESSALVEPIAENKKMEVETIVPEIKNNMDYVAPVIVNKSAADQLQTVPHLEELPALLQQAIPDMSFAGHVYSSSPLQRSVIINGAAMAEGDMLMEGLRIEQITRNGVVFDYQSQLFRVDILQDWSFD